MKEFTFQTEVWLPRPREEIFQFFSDAANLETITPSWLKFKILTVFPLRVQAGALIDYRLRVRGFPLRWQTEITEWDPPRRFVDVQKRGPYRLWHHTHTFEDRDGGTLCSDHVRYRPRGGALVNRLFVRRDVERIFTFREQRLKEIFGSRVSSA
jgi:ligand-binding SRPBCC domain-containing protein